MTTPTTCRYTPVRGWVTREHRADCTSHSCDGCRPCPKASEDHCRVRPRCGAHIDGSGCPTCAGKIRSNLTGIGNALAAMPAELEDVGRTDRSEAANHIPGSTAHPESWRLRMRLNARTGGDTEDADEHDPWQMLGIRERMIREDLGHDDLTIVSETLAGTMAYLAWVLTDLTQRHDQQHTLHDLLTETSRLRDHLEGVLRDSRAPERGAPCPKCAAAGSTDDDAKAPRLIRKWAHWCDRDDCHREHDTSGARDTWACPRDDTHWWSEADYRLWVSGDYLANASRLTAAQIETQYGVKSGTLRKWVERGKVKRRGIDQHGRAMYDVGHVRAMRDAVAVAG